MKRRFAVGKAPTPDYPGDHVTQLVVVTGRHVINLGQDTPENALPDGIERRWRSYVGERRTPE